MLFNSQYLLSYFGFLDCIFNNPKNAIAKILATSSRDNFNTTLSPPSCLICFTRSSYSVNSFVNSGSLLVPNRVFDLRTNSISLGNVLE